MTNADGVIYSGEFLHNEPHGYGAIQFLDGELVEGEFCNGTLTEEHDDGSVKIITVTPTSDSFAVKIYFEGWLNDDGSFKDGFLKYPSKIKIS